MATYNIVLVLPALISREGSTYLTVARPSKPSILDHLPASSACELIASISATCPNGAPSKSAPYFWIGAISDSNSAVTS